MCFRPFIFYHHCQFFNKNNHFHTLGHITSKTRLSFILASRMSKMALTPFALLFLSCLTIVFSYSSGPPTSRCSSLLPGHPASTGGANPGGFYIYSDLIDCNGAYNASQAYTSRILLSALIIINCYYSL